MGRVGDGVQRVDARTPASRRTTVGQAWTSSPCGCCRHSSSLRMIAEQPRRSAIASSSGPDSHALTAAAIVASSASFGSSSSDANRSTSGGNPPCRWIHRPSAQRYRPTHGFSALVLAIDSPSTRITAKPIVAAAASPTSVRTRPGSPPARRASRAAAVPAAASATAATSPTGHGVANAGSAPVTSTSPSNFHPPRSAIRAIRARLHRHIFAEGDLDRRVSSESSGNGGTGAHRGRSSRVRRPVADRRRAGRPARSPSAPLRRCRRRRCPGASSSSARPPGRARSAPDGAVPTGSRSSCRRPVIAASPIRRLPACRDAGPPVARSASRGSVRRTRRARSGRANRASAPRSAWSVGPSIPSSRPLASRARARRRRSQRWAGSPARLSGCR